MANHIEHLFMCHSYIFFDKMSVHVYCYLQLNCFLLLSFESFLYILNTNPLLEM